MADPAAPFVVAPWSFGDTITKTIGGESPRGGPTTLDEVSTAARERWAKVADWRRTPTLKLVSSALDGLAGGNLRP